MYRFDFGPISFLQYLRNRKKTEIFRLFFEIDSIEENSSILLFQWHSSG